MKIQAWDNEQQQEQPINHDNNLNKELGTNSQPPSTSTSTRASVSFAAESDNVVHDILPLTEYTPSEVRACWFVRPEYNSFKRNSLVTLQLNRAGELTSSDSEHTMRGLECRTRECTDSRRMLRFEAAAAVFNEQARQHDLNNGLQDPEALSESYHSISWHAMYDAHTQGMADEQDAQALLTLEDKLLMGPRTRRTSSSLLSKIISIESTPVELEQQVLTSSSNVAVAGLDCGFWSNNNTTNTAINYINHYNTTTNTAFNLNAFFNDMSLGGMAVPVAAA